MIIPKSEYSEILTKMKRPYNCILTKSKKGYYICIPYRSFVNHSFSFRFRKSNNKYRPGLDYTKMIIITSLNYISDEKALIDDEQYKETSIHFKRICKDACKYVDDYRNHILGIKRINSNVFKRKYYYSTLKYFHKELSIIKNG